MGQVYRMCGFSLLPVLFISLVFLSESLPEFNKKWSGQGSPDPRKGLVLSDYEDNESNSMFSKFFGSIPGFRNS
jgi:hypothetical protein